LTINEGTHGVVDEAAAFTPPGDSVEQPNGRYGQGHVDSFS
jgi:hypothetical protein